MKKKLLQEQREKAIIESFAKTFNKIKRLDENALNVTTHLKVGDRLEKIGTASPDTLTIVKIEGNKLFVKPDSVDHVFQWTTDSIDDEIKIGKLKWFPKNELNEFDYEPHKDKNIEIIDRFTITINPGSDDVIEMEGILGRHKNDHLVFKQLKDAKIFLSSNSRELIKDKEIPLGQANNITQNTVNFLNTLINKWVPIVSEGEQFRFEIPVNKNIKVAGMGANFIGSLRCIFNNIKFEKI